MGETRYTDGDYLRKHPSWHVEDSPWGATQILKMVQRNNLNPQTVCEIGCGAGEILRQLQLNLNAESEFGGYEISPQARELFRKRANERLHFKFHDILHEENVYFDLILCIDVIEHIENYFSFLRNIQAKSKYKIFHVPLDVSVQSVLRRNKLVKERNKSGHIHYFTKEIANKALMELGYNVIDYF